MFKDLVSVIMPSYNCGQYVEEAIRCVLSQTYQKWEIVFVDDCSGDDTVAKVSAICEKDKRVRLFKNEYNLGAAMSRNYALRKARGRWIAFLDSDDLWEMEKLEKQVRFMEANGYSFSYTKYEEIGEDSKPLGIEVSGPRRVSKQGMFAYCWPGCLTVMYDATKVGLIQIEDIKKNNDYAMWLKVCKKADCYLLDDCLAKYRRGRSGSISTHGYVPLIKWHYKLFHDAEGMNCISSILLTAANLVCGLCKKLRYVKKLSV